MSEWSTWRPTWLPGGIRREMAAFNVLIKAAALARRPAAAEYWFFEARREGDAAAAGERWGDWDGYGLGKTAMSEMIEIDWDRFRWWISTNFNDWHILTYWHDWDDWDD